MSEYFQEFARAEITPASAAGGGECHGWVQLKKKKVCVYICMYILYIYIYSDWSST